ncbi:hypothetical protein H2199_004034 [Coniosporium tulheliwenetii]|uniref:Uncharacterized protein n=1 Tax=Coniosporium tulheliwenetii TaxID=3383036 RepID=A0ACC2Z8C1_9PEZI|nr:hypothetical protein H2199_004034 [Cladosporium sp. JES 115]
MADEPDMCSFWKTAITELINDVSARHPPDAVASKESLSTLPAAVPPPESAPLAAREDAPMAVRADTPVAASENTLVAVAEDAPVTAPTNIPVAPDNVPVTAPVSVAVAASENRPVGFPESVPSATSHSPPVAPPEQAPAAAPKRGPLTTPARVPVVASHKAPVVPPAPWSGRPLLSGAQLQSQLNLLHRASGEMPAMQQARNKRPLEHGSTKTAEPEHHQKKTCIKRESGSEEDSEDGEILLLEQSGPALTHGRVPRPTFINIRSMQLPAAPPKVKPTKLYVHAFRKKEDGHLGVNSESRQLHWIVPPTPSQSGKSYLIRLLPDTNIFWKRTPHRARLELQAQLATLSSHVPGQKSKHGNGQLEKWTFWIWLEEPDGWTAKEKTKGRLVVKHNQQHVLVLLRAMLDCIGSAAAPAASPAPHPPTVPTLAVSNRRRLVTGGLPSTAANRVAVAHHRGGAPSPSNAGHSTPREAIGGPAYAADDVLSQFSQDYLAGYLAGQRSTGYLTGPLVPNVEAVGAEASSVLAQHGMGSMGGIIAQQPSGVAFPTPAVLRPMTPAAEILAAPPSGFVAHRGMGRMGDMMDQQLPGVWSSTHAVPAPMPQPIQSLTVAPSGFVEPHGMGRAEDTTGQQPLTAGPPANAAAGFGQYTQPPPENCTPS